MITLEMRLPVCVCSFVLFLFLPLQAAVSDQLHPLGDFTTSHPSLVPFAKCNTGGRSIVALKNPSEDPDDLLGTVTLIESLDYPNDPKVLRRFSRGSASNSSLGLFDLGCFAAGSVIVIPKSNGVVQFDRSNRERFTPYPAGFGGAHHAFSSDGFVYTVGRYGEMLQVDSQGRMRWIFEPLKGSVRTTYFSAANVMTFVGAAQTVDLDLKAFKRASRPRLALNPERYYSGAQGKLMVLAPLDEFGDYRIAVGDGSVQGSAILDDMWVPNALALNPLRLGSRMYFVANSSDVWTTDGSIRGTRLLYEGTEDDGRLSLITTYQGRLIIAGDRLLALSSNGGVTELAPLKISGSRLFDVDASGRLLLWGDGVFVRTNGSPAGTTIIKDSRIQAEGKVLALKDRVLLSTSDSAFRVDRGVLEEVPFIDTTVTTSSDPTNLGSVGNKFLFSIATSGGADVYRTEGAPDLTRRAFEIAAPYYVKGIGTVDRTLFVATGKGELYSYRPDDGRLQVKEFQGRNSTTSLSFRSEGFPSGNGLLLPTGEGIFKVDGATATASLVKALPSEVRSILGFSSLADKLYFSAISRDANWDLVSTPWVSDGTAAGTTKLTTKIPNRKPYVAMSNEVMGVYYSDASGVERLIWKARDFGYDGCSGDPKLIEIDGTYYIHGVCEGLHVVAPDLSSAKDLELFQISWTVKHQGYLYVGHTRDDGSGVVSRIRPGQQVPELVYVLDESLSLRPTGAVSLGDRVFMWLSSEHTGTEPFVLLNGADECPTDPFKATPGVCGCGVVDSDSDFNGIVDCKDVADKCPRDPNKTSPGFCGCGYPDGDADKNGRPDCLENCRMGSSFPGCNPYGTPTPYPY